MSKAKKFIKKFKEAKKDMIHGVRLDSMGVYLKSDTQNHFRSGPKSIDLKVNMTGYQDPNNKVIWRNSTLAVKDPLDLDAQADIMPEIQQAILDAAKAFDASLDASMNKLGFKKESK